MVLMYFVEALLFTDASKKRSRVAPAIGILIELVRVSKARNQQAPIAVSYNKAL